MSHTTKDIRIADYAYHLPDERIAKYPLAERDASKLLVYDHGTIREQRFRDLPGLLPEGSLIVMNNTRVIQARLHFRKASAAQHLQQGVEGALIEVFCLEPAEPNDYVLMFQQTHACTWHCLVGNAKKWKSGPLNRSIEVDGRTVTLTAEKATPASAPAPSGEQLIRFSWDDPAATWAQVLDACGELPIPPYLNRATEASDLHTYQTVYSKVEGSVAAPTAGLHFTPRVLSELDARGVERAALTLHVGAGTFKPVKSERIAGHEMHAEWIYVPRQVVDALLRHGGECTAVGTTSVRTLESLYYIGLKILANPAIGEEDLKVEQWEPYDQPSENSPVPSAESLFPSAESPVPAAGSAVPSFGNSVTSSGSIVSSSESSVTSSASPKPSAMEALKAIAEWMDRNGLAALHTATRIIIAPGYTYHIVRRMITNFHQPQSTLLLLVSAFVGGDNWRRIYRFALDNDFRFLSYGDSSLLTP